MNDTLRWGDGDSRAHVGDRIIRTLDQVENCAAIICVHSSYR